MTAIHVKPLSVGYKAVALTRHGDVVEVQDATEREAYAAAEMAIQHYARYRYAKKRRP